MSKSRLHLPHRGRAAIRTTRSRAWLVATRLAIAIALAAGAAVAVTTATASAATTLVVSANRPFRSVTHVASGGLYGLDTATIPADSLVEPLRPNTTYTAEVRAETSTGRDISRHWSFTTESAASRR